MGGQCAKHQCLKGIVLTQRTKGITHIVGSDDDWHAQILQFSDSGDTATVGRADRGKMSNPWVQVSGDAWALCRWGCAALSARTIGHQSTLAVLTLFQRRPDLSNDRTSFQLLFKMNIQCSKKRVVSCL